MSITLMSDVWKKKCDHTELIVLLALADHADDHGYNVRPSKAYIAWKTNYSVRSIQRMLSVFRERGILIPVSDEMGGRGNPTHYKLDLSSIPDKPEYERPLRLSPALRSEIIEHGNHTCAYCGKKGDGVDGPDGKPWHVDRITPAAKGGKYEPGNMVLACSSCNKSKGDREHPSGSKTDPLKGATLAPFRENDDEQKGAIALSQKGAIALSQKGAIALAPEPSCTISNHQLPETQQPEEPPRVSKKKKDPRAPKVTLPRKVAPDKTGLRDFLSLEPEQAFDAPQFVRLVPDEYRTLIRDTCKGMPLSVGVSATTSWFLDRTDAGTISADWYSNWTRYVQAWWSNHKSEHKAPSYTGEELDAHVKSVVSSQQEI